VIKAVFFDLDGTLADTAPDLALALNTLLDEEGRPAIPYKFIRPVVSHGGNALLRLGFNMEESDAGFPGLRERFLQIYENRLHQDTSLFPGMDHVLTRIESTGLIWGVITNKPEWLTRPLLHKLGLESRSACIVSGDSVNERKPHPAPMLHACHLTGMMPASTLYIGDAERDIVAGKAAGMRTLIAMYGYIDDQDHPETWQADGMISTPHEITAWIDRFNL
jgi:2-phosphoglycolate phosphatase